ncbi:hypothetical protein [Streptomyces sp. NPDC048650]
MVSIFNRALGLALDAGDIKAIAPIGVEAADTGIRTGTRTRTRGGSA